MGAWVRGCMSVRIMGAWVHGRVSVLIMGAWAHELHMGCMAT